VTTVNAAAVHDAVLAMLVAALAPIPVGDAAIPSPEPGGRRPGLGTDGTWSGYLVVYRVASGARFGGGGYLGQPESIKTIRFQIVGVGVQRDQADHLAALATSVLVDRADQIPAAYIHPLTVPGHSVMQRTEAGEVPADEMAGVFTAGYLVDVMVSIA
jgi:hypothetical protein